MTAGEQIKKIRKLNHLPQREFAAAIGVNTQTVGRWERGETSPSAARLSFLRYLFSAKPRPVTAETSETIGSRIRRLREEHGLSRKELAAAVCVHPQSVTQWENGGGFPSKSTAARLAARFDMPTERLYGLACAEDGATPGAANTVGGRLKFLRKSAGMSEEAFGAVCGARLYTVLRWEGDCYPPASEQLAAIAARFGVTEEWILSGGGGV